MILLFSQRSETGFVRKSLQPAARAFTRSLCKDEAVRATIITDDRYGDDALVERGSLLDEDEEGVKASEGVREGVAEGNSEVALIFSSRRISLVASIPSMIGIWMSICGERVGVNRLQTEDATYQNQMEASSLPLFNGLLTVVCYTIPDLLPFHERR